MDPEEDWEYADYEPNKKEIKTDYHLELSLIKNSHEYNNPQIPIYLFIHLRTAIHSILQKNNIQFEYDNEVLNSKQRILDKYLADIHLDDITAENIIRLDDSDNEELDSNLEAISDDLDRGEIYFDMDIRRENMKIYAQDLLTTLLVHYSRFFTVDDVIKLADKIYIN